MAKKSGSKIKYDLSGQDPEESVKVMTRESPRPGMYVATIMEVNPRDAGGDPDRPMLEVVFEVTDAEKKKNQKYVGSRIWWYVMLPGHESFDSTAWKLDQLLMATGIASKKKRKGSFDLADVMGLDVVINVRGGKNQDGDYRGEVGAVLAYDEDEWGSEASDDDEDEEDEDVEASDDDEEEEEDEESEEEEEEEEADEDEEESEYADMTLKDLRREAKARGLSTKDEDGNNLSKDDLVDALEEDDGESEDEEEDEEEEEEDEPKPTKRTRKPAAKKQSAKSRKSAAKRGGKKGGGKSKFPFDD